MRIEINITVNGMDRSISLAFTMSDGDRDRVKDRNKRWG